MTLLYHLVQMKTIILKYSIILSILFFFLKLKKKKKKKK